MDSKFEIIADRKVELIPKIVDSMDYARLMADRMQKKVKIYN